MTELSKSQKIRISLTIIWGIITALFAGVAAQDYSSFNFLTFLGVLIILNLPILLYWLGFWIWGNGYLSKAIFWPFKKILGKKKEGQESSIGRKILAGFLAVLAFTLVGALIGVAEEAPKYIFQSFSERALRNVEALAAILVLILAVLAAGKTYCFIARSKNTAVEAQQENLQIEVPKKHKIIGHIVTVLAVLFALSMIFISANEQETSAAYLFGEVIGASVLFGVLVMLFTPKKWMKPYQTPLLSVVFFIASVFISYPQYKEARDARDAVLSMVESIEQEYIDAATAETLDEVKVGTVNVPPSSKMAPFINWVNQSRERAAAIIIDYANSFSPEFENTLTPENLSDIASIRKSKAEIIQILNTIPAYNERAETHFETIEKELQSLNVSEELKSGALKGLRENMDANIASYNEYFAIQEGMLQEFLSLLTLMEDAYGTYEYDESGQVFFTHDQHIEKYNDLMASITNYVLLEQEWGQKVQAKELKAVKKMKEQYSE